MVILSDVVAQLPHKEVTEYFSTCKLTFVRIVLYRVSGLFRFLRQVAHQAGSCLLLDPVNPETIALTMRPLHLPQDLTLNSVC